MSAERRKDLEDFEEGRKRFAAQIQTREAFGVPPNAVPGDSAYDAGLDRYMKRLADNP